MNIPQSAPNTQTSRSSGAGLGVSQWQAANPSANPPLFADNAATTVHRTGFAEFQNGATSRTDTSFAGNNDPRSPYSAQPANYRGQGPDNGMPLNPTDDNDFPFPDARGGQRGGAINQVGATSRAERLPPPMPGAPVGASPNPNVRTTPTAEGQRLALGPNETAADRAVMLAQVLETTQAEAIALRERVRYLEQQQQALERARADGAQVADQAASEMARARTQMEALHVEVVQLRERLRRLDRQDLDTLREVVDGLESLLHEDNSKKQ